MLKSGSGNTMNYAKLEGCNAPTNAQQCDCRVCIDYKLDLMETLRMEFDF